MSYILNNLSKWRLNTLVRACDFSISSKLKSVKVVVSDVWFDHDHHLETGEIIDEDTETEWDGSCFPEHKTIYIHLNKNTEFPLIWWPSNEIEGKYMRGMVLLSPAEYFVYCVAHESRHIEQETCITKLARDDEADADLYAIIKLNEYRVKTNFIDYRKRP